MRCRNHRPASRYSHQPPYPYILRFRIVVYRFLHTVKREVLLICCRLCCPLRSNPQRLVVLENGLMVSHEPSAVDGFRHLANGWHAAKIRNDLGDNKTSVLDSLPLSVSGPWSRWRFVSCPELRCRRKSFQDFRFRLCHTQPIRNVFHPPEFRVLPRGFDLGFRQPGMTLRPEHCELVGHIVPWAPVSP